MTEGIIPTSHQTVPPLAEHTAERSTDANDLLERNYQAFKQYESREAHPTDRLFVGHLPQDSVEYDTLRASGVAEADIATGYVTRGELQGAGYFFLNRLGGQEKYIIADTIPDPDRPGEVLDFKGRALLTRDELQKVYDFQQQHPERYGLQGHDLEEIRKDMLLFLMRATHRPRFERGEDFVDATMPYRPEYAFFDGNEYFDKWKLVDAFWADKAKQYARSHPDARGYNAIHGAQKEFVQAYCSDLYTWPDEAGETVYFDDRVVRGRAVQSISHRMQKLSGNPSPFLDSGLHFSDFPNLDVNIYMAGRADMRSTNQYRLNMAVLHLAGGHPDFPGLSEMGGTDDQIYMPTGVYVSEILDHSQAERAAELEGLTEAPGESIIAEAQRRVVAAAEQHAQQGGRLRRLAQLAVKHLPRPRS